MATRKKAPTNPFSFGGLALDEAFADREAEVQELKFDAMNGQDVVIIAPRRFGKSSLVWRTMRELAAADVLVAYVNLMTTPTRERLAGRLAAAIYEDVASRSQRAAESLLRPFRGLRVTPSITVDPDAGTYSFTFGVGHAPADIDATIERLLELPGELAAEEGKRVVLVLDEFQEIEGIDPALPRLMRTIFEQQPEVARIYLGSRRHMMERIFNDENEPFWRSAKRVELGPIDVGDWVPFIVDRFKRTRKRAARDLAGDLVERTAGHPYATQELSYFLWEEVPFDAAATSEHLDRAVAAVLRSENSHFQLRWEEASTAQKLLLAALAEEPGRPMTSDYRRRHGLPTAATIQTALRALEQRELVAQAPGERDHRIAEPFLAEWIRALGEPGPGPAATR
jgi:hypothetical protein